MLLKDNSSSADDNIPENIPPPESGVLTQYLLDIEINGVDSGSPVLSYVDNLDRQNVSVPLSALKDHGIDIEEFPNEKEYVTLKEISWIQSKIDLKKQKLWLEIPVEKFHERFIEGGLKDFKKPPDMSVPGSYINYDISAQNVHQKKDIQGLSGIGEAVHFNAYGFGTMSGLFRETSHRNDLIRLETNWTLDQFKEQASWRIGDSITRVDDWGGSARFGGLQWATNFATQPNFITYPVPTMKGQSTVPSNLDVFINDTYSLSRKVDRGPFGINDLPVVNGEGNVALITTDILGRRQEIVIPYYVSPSLLKPGLKDYSFEVGSLREEYGVKSHKYSKGVAAGTYRQGITPKWTLGGHSEMMAKVKNVGLTNQYLVANYGVLTNSLAGSHASCGQGILISNGFFRQTKNFSIGTRIQITRGPFSQIGLYEATLAPKLTIQNYANYSFKDYGSVGVSYTEQRMKYSPRLRFLTASYQNTFMSDFNFNLFMSSNIGDKNNKQIGINIVYVINQRTLAISTTQMQRKNSSQTMGFQRSKGEDSDLDYRLLASKGHHTHAEAEVGIDKDYGDYRVRASRDHDKNNIELNTRGSVIYFGDAVFVSKYINNSFGLVQVPGMSNVAVYDSNRLVGKTNADGHILVPNLRSYEENKVNIDVKDLPINASLSKNQTYLRPARRSGVLAHFPIDISTMQMIRLADEEGEALAAGTIVYEKNSTNQYVVGMDGEAYIQMPHKSKEIHLETRGAESCLVKISIPENSSKSNITAEYQCKKLSVS